MCTYIYIYTHIYIYNVLNDMYIDIHILLLYNYYLEPNNIWYLGFRVPETGFRAQGFRVYL